jgi:hypothetical protein
VAYGGQFDGGAGGEQGGGGEAELVAAHGGQSGGGAGGEQGGGGAPTRATEVEGR